MVMFYEYLEDLTYEQIGQLTKMACIYERDNEILETNDSVVKLIFKTKVKKDIDKRKDISKRRSQYAKQGGGRPKKTKGDK